MKVTLFCILTVSFAICAAARPIPVTSSLRFYPPAPYEARSAAINGDELFITGFANGELAIFLYRRQSGNTWTLVRKLHGATGYTPGTRASIKAEGNVAAALFDQDLFIFESAGGNWTRATVSPTTEPINSVDVAINRGRVMVGVSTCGWNSAILAKSASGAWAQTHLLDATNLQPCGSIGIHRAGDFDNDIAAITVRPPGWPGLPMQLWHYHLPPDQPHMYQYGMASQPTPMSYVAREGLYTYASANPVTFAYRHEADGAIYNDGTLRPLMTSMMGNNSEIIARDGLIVENVIFT